jgi:two-component system CheB/CheR fusion protein
LPVFHYALKPAGLLFLGPSESISRHGELFSAVDKKHRIFQRRPTLGAVERIPAWVAAGRSPQLTGATIEVGKRKDQRLKNVVDGHVLEHFAPAHIVVEADGNIVFYSSRTGKYLEPQTGAPSRQILSMARKGLRLELRTALREAVEHRSAAVREHVEIDIDDRVQIIRLLVQPLDNDPDPLYLIVFCDIGPPLAREDIAHYRPPGLSSDVSQLEQELKDTRDRLQATIEEYETALEELKSGNEELVSVNEARKSKS